MSKVTRRGRRDFAAPFKIALPDEYEPRAAHLFIKRLFDIAVSFLRDLVLLLPVLIIVLLIRLDSTGSAMFRQGKLGKGGKHFEMLMFRSAHLNAAADGPWRAEITDPRCTRVGHVMRNSRPDELPSEEKLTFDMEYIDLRCVGIDLVCIPKTVLPVFIRKGAR